MLKNDDKDVIIMKLQKLLQDIGQSVQDDDTLSTEHKLMQVDVILDTMKFLKDYDINIKVLNKYWLNKKWNDKFNSEGR